MRESVLEPGVEPDPARRRRGRVAMALGALGLAGALAGGWSWWGAVDAAYRSLDLSALEHDVGGCRERRRTAAHAGD